MNKSVCFTGHRTIADDKEKETVIDQQNLRRFTDNGYVIIEGGGRGE